MSDTLKKIIVGFAALFLIVGAFLIGRGGGGAGIEKSVPFSIQVNPSGSYEIAIAPADVTVTKGAPLTFAVTNVPSGGFDAQIQYTVGGLPPGSYSFSVNPVNAGQASVLTVNTTLLQSNTGYSCTLSAVDK
jgi:hypothetical protein